jgi:hypothetical protein
VYPLDPYKGQNLCARKLYRFIFYQAMCNKKKCGGKGGTAPLSWFDSSEYNTVVGNYHQWLLSPTETPAEPENPVCERMIAAYKTATVLGLLKIKWPVVSAPLLGTTFKTGRIKTFSLFVLS